VTPAQRSLYGRIGAALARARHDPRDLTLEARRRFLARFEQRVRDEFPDLPDAEIQRRAGELRRAHMLSLAAKSAKKRAATRDKVTTQEERDATARPPTAA
jgi:hypothetical protein